MRVFTWKIVVNGKEGVVMRMGGKNRKVRYCVTGADGYLGKGIVKTLLDNGVEVIAAGFNSKGVDERAEIVAGDIFELHDPYNDSGKPDTIVHLAWRDGFNHKASSHIEDLPKHCAFVSALAESPIEKLCVMGSMHEVGYHEGSVRADTPCFPMSRYGISKNALRDFCFLVARENNIECLWMRGYYIVDGDPNGCSVFSKIAQANLAGKKKFPLTSGKNRCDFLDYDVFCEMAVKTVMQPGLTGIVNICSGEPESLGSRVERFVKDEGFDIELQYGVYPDRLYDSPGIWGDLNESILAKGIGSVACFKNADGDMR